MHLQIAHLTHLHPRVARLRKRRERVARAVRPSRAAELGYLSDLSRLVAEVKAAGTAFLASIRHKWQTHDLVVGSRDAAGADAKPNRFAHELSTARSRFQGARGVGVTVATKFAGKSLAEVDTRLARSVEASIGVDIRATLTGHGPIAEVLSDAVDENVDLITSIPEQYFDELGDLVSEAWSNGDRWESLVDDVAELGGTTESRAELIARDQTGKLNAKFNQVRQTSLGVEKFEWQTAGDERVRDSHAELDGKVFAWDDPPTVDGEEALPGEPINCRCVGAPVIDLDPEESDDGEGEADLEMFS